MSSPTGNFRGQRTQSSTSGYKTIGSSIVSGNNSGSCKRIFVSALGNTNGNYDLAFTKTLGIPKNYYISSSNSHYYQQPTLSGKTRQVETNPNAKTLTQVSQSATVGNTLCVNNPTYLSSYSTFFFASQVPGSYYGSLSSQFTDINPNTYLIIQNTEILQIDASDNSQNTYSFGNFIVVVNNGGQITLKVNNNTGYGGIYFISPNCPTSEGAATCINSNNISSYSNIIKRFFPAGFYFNLPNCSS
jgi:hypothetical protein